MPLLVLGVALLGLAVGSFLNVVVHRVPAGLSVSHPPSACPVCGHRIRARHNVPIVSWLLLRGRCADCGTRISARYPVVELTTAVLFVLVALRLVDLGLVPALPAYLYFVAIGVALAAIDLDTGRLPDRIVLPAYPVLALLLTAAALVEGDLSALVRAAVGAAASYALFYAALYAFPGGMGFGDVKLAGPVGAVLAYLSYPVLVVGVFSAFLLGAVLGIAWRVARPAAVSTGASGSSPVASPTADAAVSAPTLRTTAIPFGPFMVAGALVAVFVGAPISDLYARLLLPA